MLNTNTLRRACWAHGHLDDRATSTDAELQGVELFGVNLSDAVVLALIWGLTRAGVQFTFAPATEDTACAN